jgi:hypothetical protein
MIINDNPIEQVAHFKYAGSDVTYETDQDIN